VYMVLAFPFSLSPGKLFFPFPPSALSELDEDREKTYINNRDNPADRTVFLLLPLLNSLFFFFSPLPKSSARVGGRRGEGSLFSLPLFLAPFFLLQQAALSSSPFSFPLFSGMIRVELPRLSFFFSFFSPLFFFFSFSLCSRRRKTKKKS